MTVSHANTISIVVKTANTYASTQHLLQIKRNMSV